MTGVGKITSLRYLIEQDIKQQVGVCVFDPHGDLIRHLIGSLHDKKDRDRVILLDTKDENRVFGINLYQCDVPLVKNLRIYKQEEKNQGGRATKMSPDSRSQSLPPFEILYDRYHAQVYRYLYAHLKDEHDAADLLQHVFFQAWKQRKTYEPRRGSVTTWLFSIAHHRLVDFYRTSRPDSSWESMPDMPTMDQNPEEHVIEAEAVAQVKSLLEALSRPEQELLALRFAAGLSSAEIASVIGKSEAATKKQLTRLLHRLREQYRRQAFEETPLPELLEPVLPAFVAALLQAYAVPLPTMHLQTVRHSLLEQAHLALS